MSKLKEIALDIIRLGRTHDEEPTRYLKSNEQRLNENFRRLKEATESIMSDYLPKEGGIITGDIQVGGNIQVGGGIQVGGDVQVDGRMDITNRRAEANLPSPGWYRVLEFTPTSSFASYDLTGAIGALIRFHISRRYYWQGAENHEITLSFINGNIKFKDETSSSSVFGIDKIRYTRNSTTGFVDIHYLCAQENQVGVDFDVFCPLEPNGAKYNFKTKNLVAVADAPSGETIATTYSLTGNTAIERTTFTPTAGSSYAPYGGCWYRRDGKVVTVHVGIGGITANTSTTIYTLPDGLKPSTDIVGIGIGYALVNTDFCRMFVYANGALAVLTQSDYANVTITYLVD